MLAVAVSLDLVPSGIVVHALIFLGMVAVLSRFVLRPLAAVREQRIQAVAGRLEQRARYLTKAELLASEYQTKMKSARELAMAEREAARQRGVAEATKVMQSARADSMAALAKAREEFGREVGAARQILSGDAKEFARLIVERIAERDLQHASTEQDPPDLRSVVGKSH